MLIELCPCCGVRLLRHASRSGSFLRCGSCRFEIPEELPSVANERAKTVEVLDSLAETATAS